MASEGDNLKWDWYSLFGMCLTILYSILISIVSGDVKSVVYENIMDDDSYVIISIWILCTGALFGGVLLQRMVVCFNGAIILPRLYNLIV